MSVTVLSDGRSRRVRRRAAALAVIATLAALLVRGGAAGSVWLWLGMTLLLGGIAYAGRAGLVAARLAKRQRLALERAERALAASEQERKRAEAAMRELETLGTMGRLAARIAHEINNPLAGIQNSLLLVKNAVPRDHPHYSYVGAIEREIARIAAITRQLYETYRPYDLPEAPAPVIIADAVRMLEQVNRESQVKIRVDASGAPGVLPVPGALLRQAVYNLVQNAIEASPPGETVTVRAWLDDGRFCLSVRDRGPGVPPETREQIFEPFISTKRGLTTGGMGLGLTLVRRSARALGGSVEVHDPPDGGAEFRVQLPLDGRDARSRPCTPTAAS